MLRESVDLKPLHDALAVAFTGFILPKDHTAVVVEPKIVSAQNVSTKNSCTPPVRKLSDVR